MAPRNSGERSKFSSGSRWSNPPKPSPLPPNLDLTLSSKLPNCGTLSAIVSRNTNPATALSANVRPMIGLPAKSNLYVFDKTFLLPGESRRCSVSLANDKQAGWMAYLMPQEQPLQAQFQRCPSQRGLHHCLFLTCQTLNPQMLSCHRHAVILEEWTSLCKRPHHKFCVLLLQEEICPA